MIIKLLAEGGAMKPGPALSQKLGPAGIPINKVLDEVNKATENFKGMKVPVELDVNTKTKTFEIRIFSPPVAELLKGELNIKIGSGDHKKLNVANASIEQIIKVAKTKQQNLLCKDLKSSVKIVLGSCVSLGILVENNLAKEIVKEVEKGKYDKEIKNSVIETPIEKKKELESYFKELKARQDKVLQAEKSAADASDAKKKKK
jgi:large subunit ribosomal protein L11